MALFRIGAAAAVAVTLAACANPVATVEQGATSSSLYFPNAPEGARASVDGVDMGEAAAYNGKKMVMTVEPGKHRVVVRSAGGAILYDQNVYVGDDSRLAIEVR